MEMTPRCRSTRLDPSSVTGAAEEDWQVCDLLVHADALNHPRVRWEVRGLPGLRVIPILGEDFIVQLAASELPRRPLDREGGTTDDVAALR